MLRRNKAVCWRLGIEVGLISILGLLFYSCGQSPSFVDKSAAYGDQLGASSGDDANGKDGDATSDKDSGDLPGDGDDPGSGNGGDEGNQSPVISSKPNLLHPYYLSNQTELTLEAHLRDFKDTHPDFESFNTGHRVGMVRNTLDADGKPVYIAQPGSAATSQETVAQWYRNVAGVNSWSKIPIRLQRDNNGVYTYHNSSFFPLDGKGFGNQGRVHNFHFTLELGTTFTYQGGEVFNFTGDDDVWVFINDKLAVDIGGVHSAVSGSVALDTLGLVKGKDYNFKLFFAERHTNESNFKITTSIKLKTNTDYTYQVVASDPDGDELVYKVLTDLSAASMSSKGLLRIPVTESDIGKHKIVIQVEDQKGRVVSQEFTLEVEAR